MRFTKLVANPFGPLRNRELALDSDIVLVHGPNEAGKSTFATALETVLYGFRPADRALHPLAGWGAGDHPLQLEADLQLDTGERLRVERVLLQSAKSRIASGDAPFSGPRRGNAELSQVSWLSRDVFGALYSLELAQLALLSPRVRSDVDDLLLPPVGELPLRPLSEVRVELERDHLELWRPDNRGKPAAKRLRAELALAREQASAAADREHTLRAARAERAEREAHISALKARKRIVERDRDDAPLLGALFELRQRRQRLGPPADLTALGDLPLTKPSQLAAEIEELEDRLRAPAARLACDALELATLHHTVLDGAPEIERLVALRPAWEADEQRLDERRLAAARARERASGTLAGACEPGSPPGAARLARASDVPLTALTALQARWAEQSALDAAEGVRAGARTRALTLLAGFAGLAGAGLAAFERIDPRLGLASLVLTFGTLLVALTLRPLRRGEPTTRPETIDTLLRGLPLAEPLLADPAALQRTTELLASVQDLLAEAHEAERDAARLAERIERNGSSAAELCRRVGLEPDGDGAVLTTRLGAALAAARVADDAVLADTAERAEAERLCQRDQPLLSRKLEHRRRLEVALHGAEPHAGSLDHAFELVRERIAEADFLRRRDAELRGDPRYPLLEDDPRARGDRPAPNAPWLDAMTAARSAALGELEDELAADHRRLGELTELLGEDRGSALARATDGVRALEEELRAVERERDRLALLDSIVGRAEREYREAHQPDVLRRASIYLNRVTLGRYTRIDLLDEPAGGLCVSRADHDEPVVVGPPLSQGTRDQIFLCLRLGLLDHLDEGRERLPLLLDDALVRMDDQRRHEVYALLGEVAPVRQIYLLTCHTALADEIAGALKVRRLDLS